MTTLDSLLSRFAVPTPRPASPIAVQACRAPDLVNLYAALGLNTGVEIGVDQGLFAAELCRANPALKLTGVDPWLDYPGYGELVGAQGHADRCYAAARNRLAPYGVTLLRQMSLEAVGAFADNSLDFVYIDGNHAYQYVLDDITAWSAKVRPGGIVSGHDYCRPRNRARWQFQEVVRAVNDYTAANKVEPWFVLRGGGCSGYLWVKA